MAILTIVCSQSTGNTANQAGFVNRFHVRLPHSIPIRGTCQLVEYTAMCQTASDTLIPAADGNPDIPPFEKLISVDVPWLDSASSHVIGGSFNTTANGGNDARRNYDKSRHNSRKLLLPCLHQNVLVHPSDMHYVTNTTTIPSEFDVTITSGYTGEAYNNVMMLVLKFKIEVAGLFI